MPRAVPGSDPEVVLEPYQATVGGVRLLAFSPDGGRCAVVHSTAEVTVFEVATDRPLLTLPPQGSVDAIDWHPAAERLAVASGTAVGVWDTTAGVPLLVLDRHTNPPPLVGWDRTGRRLLTAADDAVFVWDGSPTEAAGIN